MNELLFLVNTAVCIAGIFASFCRLNLMSKSTSKPVFKQIYTIRLAVFFLSLGSFSFGVIPTTIQVFIVALLFVEMLLGAEAWKYGQPDHVRL